MAKDTAVVYIVDTPLPEETLAVQKWLATKGVESAYEGAWEKTRGLVWVTSSDEETPFPEFGAELYFTTDSEQTKSNYLRMGCTVREVDVDFREELVVDSFKIKKTAEPTITVEGGDYTVAKLKALIAKLEGG